MTLRQKRPISQAQEFPEANLDIETAIEMNGLPRKRRLTDYFNDLHLHSPSDIDGLYNKNTISSSSSNNNNSNNNNDINDINENSYNSGSQRQSYGYTRVPQIPNVGYKPMNDNSSGGYANELYQTSKRSSTRSDPHTEYIASIDEYLKDDPTTASVATTSSTKPNDAQILLTKDPGGVSDGNTNSPKYYISKKFVDPLLVLKTQGDADRLQQTKKLYFDRILLEKKRRQCLNNRENKARNGSLDSASASANDNDSDSDMMEIDEGTGAGFKRQKLRQSASDVLEVSNDEIYYRMYMDKNYSVIKHYDPRAVVWWVWQEWVARVNSNSGWSLRVEVIEDDKDRDEDGEMLMECDG